MLRTSNTYKYHHKIKINRKTSQGAYICYLIVLTQGMIMYQENTEQYACTFNRSPTELSHSICGKTHFKIWPILYIYK